MLVLVFSWATVTFTSACLDHFSFCFYLIEISATQAKCQRNASLLSLQGIHSSCKTCTLSLSPSLTLKRSSFHVQCGRSRWRVASVFNDGLVLYRVILKVITGKPQCSRNMPDAHKIVRTCVYLCTSIFVRTSLSFYRTQELTHIHKLGISLSSHSSHSRVGNVNISEGPHKCNNSNVSVSSCNSED